MILGKRCSWHFIGIAQALLLASWLAPTMALAVDQFEIQVYDAEINEPSQPSLELHFNHVLQGRSEPDYFGEIPPDHVTHLALETALGLMPFWEAGSYLQMVVDSNGDAHWAGFKLRSKFVVPEGTWESFRLGVNVEVANIPHDFEPASWSSEIRPIVGYEGRRWAFYVNPNLSFPLSGGHTTPAFEPCTKLRFDTGLGFGIGAEYYGEIGPIDAVPAVSQQEHYLYLVGDLLQGPMELNLGVGYGLTEASNRWVVKLILGKAFGPLRNIRRSP